jgi:hypothetical protein
MVLAIAILATLAVGCTPAKENKVADLKEIHEAVKESLGEGYIPDRDMEKEELENIVGVSTDDMAEYIAQAPMISVNIDNFIAIKAKEGKADEIEKGLVDYKDYLIENSMQYPMNLAKVNAADVVRHGDYIFFLMLGKYDDRDDAREEEQLEFAQAEVRKVEDVIAEFFK